MGYFFRVDVEFRYSKAIIKSYCLLILCIKLKLNNLINAKTHFTSTSFLKSEKLQILLFLDQLAAIKKIRFSSLVCEMTDEIYQVQPWALALPGPGRFNNGYRIRGYCYRQIFVGLLF